MAEEKRVHWIYMMRSEALKVRLFVLLCPSIDMLKADSLTLLSLAARLRQVSLILPLPLLITAFSRSTSRFHFFFFLKVSN